MKALFILISLFLAQAAIADSTQQLQSLSFSATPTTQIISQIPCQLDRDGVTPVGRVTAIKIHPNGPSKSQFQLYTIQALTSSNVWETPQASGPFAANQDSDWMTLSVVGVPRCLKQVLIYGGGIGAPMTVDVYEKIAN